MGTPIHNLLYEDETGQLWGQVEVDGRFFIHSVLHDPQRLSNIRNYRRVLDSLEESLRSRGATEYYTMADCSEGFAFNELMGFETNYEVWNDQYEIMVKRI